MCPESKGPDIAKIQEKWLHYILALTFHSSFLFSVHISYFSSIAAGFVFTAFKENYKEVPYL